MVKRILILFILGINLLIGAEKPDETFGLYNGRYWNSLSHNAQPFFLIGMLEGWKFHQGRSFSITIKEAKAFWSGSRFSVGDLQDMLISIYEAPENLDLPIGWAIMACYSVKRGDTTRDVVFKHLRKALSNELERKDPHPANDFDPMDVILNPQTE